MAFGFVILTFILLLLGSLAAFGYYGIPVAIVGTMALGFLFLNRLKRSKSGPGDGDGPGEDRKHAGPRPRHKREAYAHTGQAYMTPEQMRTAPSWRTSAGPKPQPQAQGEPEPAAAAETSAS